MRCRPRPETVPVKYPDLGSSYALSYQASAAPHYAALRGPPVRPPMMRGGHHNYSMCIRQCVS